MKKFAKLFVVALVVTLIASAFVISSSAAATDPKTLQPGSEQVFFIMDAPEGEALPGDGSGKDAQNPLKPIDHEGYDPEAEPARLRQDLMTAFYQATELLKDTGGTIVICGPVLLGPNQTYGTVAATTRDVYTANHGTNTIKFTSVYNGVDYRETNGAKITLEAPAEIGVNGQSIWENIDIETKGTDRVISFHHWSTLIGEGVKCYPQEALYANVSSYYVSLSGGHRYSGGVDKTPSMVVQSGTYNTIVAGVWGVNNSRTLKDDGSIRYTNNNDGATVAKIVLEGNTTVLGQIIGTTKKAAEFSGTSEIVINSGTYSCDISLVGLTGMYNKEGIVTLRINGGDFSKAWSISPTTPGYTNNAPAAGLLDFSGWTGDKAALAVAYNLATTTANTPFTTIQLPSGVTAEELQGMASQTTPPAGDGTTAPSGDGEATAPPTNAIIIGGNESTPEETDSAVDVNDGGDSNILLIVLIAVGALVLVAAAVIIVLLLKKKK